MLHNIGGISLNRELIKKVVVKIAKLHIFQKGFNYSQDGPGNRLVYHLKGCNLKCPWCSNPEVINPNNSLGYSMEVSEVLKEILRSAPMFFEGGGVTFTGGECTLQLPALIELFELLKKEGINTAIETNGTNKDLEKLFPFLDYLIMDLKHSDEKILKEVTGADLAVIKSNLLKAREQNKRLFLRIPLINTFNADEKTVNAFLEYFKEINYENLTVELLKYHEYGKDKWEQNGLTYKFKDGFVTEEFRKAFEEKLKQINIKVIRT